MTFSWPMTLEAFGGMERLARRVSAAQAGGESANFALLQSAGRQHMKAKFFRAGFFTRCDFSGSDPAGMVLVSAEVRRKARGRESALWISVNRDARGGGGRVGVAYDDDRGFMVAVDAGGEAETLALPFSSGSLQRVPSSTKGMYCRSGCSLASWAVHLLVSLCRHDAERLGEVLAVLEDLRDETEGQFDEMLAGHELEPGSGMTKLRLGDSPLLRV